MTDESANLVLEHLRHIRRAVDRIEADVGDLKVPMSAVGEHFGQQQLQLSALNKRTDRFDERLARVERRLDLADA